MPALTFPFPMLCSPSCNALPILPSQCNVPAHAVPGHNSRPPVSPELTTVLASALPSPCLGGYSFPFTIFFGAHVHHSLSGIASRTEGICWPQPHQVACWQIGQVRDMHILTNREIVLVVRLLGGIDEIEEDV